MKKLSGAKNVANYRVMNTFTKETLKNSVKFEGLFNEYHFNTNKINRDELSYPHYSVNSCKNVHDEIENYLTISTHSSLDGKKIRDTLNLIVLLDVSGSMDESLKNTEKSSEDKSTTSNTKIEIAKYCLKEIVKVLTDEESIGIILFNTKPIILSSIKQMNITDKEDLLGKIDDISANGGTNMEEPYEFGIDMMKNYIDQQGSKNNRIIFITDANPNSGGGEKSLISLSRKAAKENIYTTFIGVGLDFNSSMVNEISKVKGGNYFSVVNFILIIDLKKTIYKVIK
jgi:Ca-activated chloride channel family protein